MQEVIILQSNSGSQTFVEAAELASSTFELKSAGNYALKVLEKPQSYLQQRTGVVFVSLQADNIDAKKINSRFELSKLYIDESIGPVIDLDNHLAQIEAIEKVISIDYSVSHFSEALEIPPHCALFYRRTWQWSDGKSAHSSVVVGDEWGAEF